MKSILLAFFFTVAAAFTAVADTWTDLKGMNEHIMATNFVVNNGCSGTLIDKERKLILTNKHCVTRALKKEVKEVVTEDGEVVKKTFEERLPLSVVQGVFENHEAIQFVTYMTEIVATDTYADLALLQIKADSIPHTIESEVYKGGDLLLGQTVYAVGNPNMLELTVSKGVLSNLNRKFIVEGSEHPYFQMDARITGGSSGGAMYNEEGFLVGVPAAGNRDGSVNLAIPYTFVNKFLEGVYKSKGWE